MCIDVFAPGQCIDIDFMLEQIWFTLDGNGGVTIEEVYDLLLRNPGGSGPLENLLLLFPHDSTKAVRGDDRELDLQTLSLHPARPDSMARYEWLYKDAPSWVDGPGSEVVVRVSADPDDPHEMWRPLRGKELDLTPSFPEKMKPLHKQLLSETSKTLLQLSIQPALAADQQAWIRVIVKPKKLDVAGKRCRRLPDTSVEILNDWRLAVVCPLNVRDRLNAGLFAKARKATSPEAATAYRKLHEMIVADGFFAKGTSTRICDHRIALIACEGIDLLEGSVSHTVKSHGTIPLGDPERIGLWWGAGSKRNERDDLVHNAQAIVDRLKETNEPISRRSLQRDLAPSGKYKAFSMLVDKAIEAGLLTEGEGYISLPLPRTRERLSEGMAKLRGLYLHPARDPATGEINPLMGCFRDLHPFAINFRLSWFPPRLADRLVEFFLGRRRPKKPRR
jgi:hypothetical protein